MTETNSYQAGNAAYCTLLPCLRICPSQTREPWTICTILHKKWPHCHIALPKPGHSMVIISDNGDVLWGRHWTELSNVVWCICHYVASVCVLGWTWNLECCTWHCSTGCVQEFVMGVTTLALCPGQALVHNWPFEGPHCAAISCSMTDLCQWLSPMESARHTSKINWKYTTISPYGGRTTAPCMVSFMP